MSENSSIEIVNDTNITNTEEAIKKYGNCKFIMMDTDQNGENGWLYAVSKSKDSYKELNRLAQNLVKQGKNVLTSGFYEDSIKEIN